VVANAKLRWSRVCAGEMNHGITLFCGASTVELFNNLAIFVDSNIILVTINFTVEIKCTLEMENQSPWSGFSNSMGKLNTQFIKFEVISNVSLAFISSRCVPFVFLQRLL